MPFPSETFLEFIRQRDGHLSQEFEHFYAQLEGYLRTEHKEDGSHSDVHADSVTATGDIAAGGDLSAQDGAIFLGNRTTSAANYTLDPLLLRITPSSIVTADTYLAHGRDAYGQYCALYDVTADCPQWVVYRLTSGTVFQLGPPSFRTGTYDLGGNASSALRWDTIYGKTIDASLGFVERGRTASLGDWTTYTPTWTGVGSNPSLGNGTLTGRYAQVGHTVWFHVALTIGSTTTLGTGAWDFSTPVNSAATQLVGTMVAVNSAAASLGVATQNAVGSVRGLSGFPTAFPLDATTPAAWTTGDTLELHGSFELA